MATVSGSTPSQQRCLQRSTHDAQDVSNPPYETVSVPDRKELVQDCLPEVSGATSETKVAKNPKHPKYQHVQDRYESFVAWPSKFVPKSPNELATAGFFYIGSADRVTCFQCGITLRDWEEEHDPIIEHERYSKNCDFIQQVRDHEAFPKERREEVRNSSFQHSSRQGDDADSSSEATKVYSRSTTPSARRGSQPGLNVVSESPRNEVKDKDKVTNKNFDSCHHTLKTDLVKNENAKVSNPKQSDHIASLVAENKRLKEEGICKLCRTNFSNILFLPCAHLITCTWCAETLESCVRCGKTVLGTVKTYRA